MKNYLSMGFGVNSVAMHLMLLDQGIDFESVFVHHGTDWPETYDYAAGFQWWLKAHGYKPVTILYPNKTIKKTGEHWDSLIDYCEDREVMPYRQRRWCTADFKVRPLLKYCEAPCFQFIGIDAGESHRAKISTDAGIEHRWPLIEQGIDREGCKKIIADHGLPIPRKSGCYICPFQRKSQWKELRVKHPCLFSRAVALEQVGMKKSMMKSGKEYPLAHKPLPDLVNENQQSLFEEMEYPPCQCGL